VNELSARPLTFALDDDGLGVGHGGVDLEGARGGGGREARASYRGRRRAEPEAASHPVVVRGRGMG
jgi:hypothetical protein